MVQLLFIIYLEEDREVIIIYLENKLAASLIASRSSVFEGKNKVGK